MIGINVLSEIPKGGKQSENMASSKGKDGSESYGDAATVFAAMLNGRMDLFSNSKGQSSSLAGQDSEETQTNASPIHSNQHPNGLENPFGYGNFALPFLTQLTLQGDLPAGKDANSGVGMSQGTENPALANPVVTNSSNLSNVTGTAGNNLELAWLDFVSMTSNEGLVPTGMTAQNPQGENHGITELAKYRQVITNLLAALSGTITDVTPKGNLSGVDILQGLMTVADDAGKESSALVKPTVAGDVGISSPETKDLSQELMQQSMQQLLEGLAAGGNDANPELNSKAASLLATLYPMLVDEARGAKAPSTVNGAIVNLLKGLGIDLALMANTPKETALLTNAQQKPEGTGLQESKFSKGFQGLFNEEVNKTNTTLKSVELFGTKDYHNPPLNTGIGVVANALPISHIDGRISTIPVWEQLATIVREQVMNKQQALKELDIQLHPANLGRVQVLLRWENGQVHLQVHASEASTGQLLQNQLSELRQNLMNQGVNCGSLEMGQGRQQQQSEGDEARRELQQSQTLLNEDEDLSSNINSHSQDEVYRINVTA